MGRMALFRMSRINTLRMGRMSCHVLTSIVNDKFTPNGKDGCTSDMSTEYRRIYSHLKDGFTHTRRMDLVTLEGWIYSHLKNGFTHT